MATIEEIQAKKGQWLFLAPVSGFSFSGDVKQELTIGEVTFLTEKRLIHTRKRFGFEEPISSLKKKLSHHKFFEEYKTYAVYVSGGTGKKVKTEFLKAVENSLKILSLSQLGWGRRSSNANLALLRETRLGHLSYLTFNLSESDSIFSQSKVGKHMTLNIDQRWTDFQYKHSFFRQLLNVYAGKASISDAWRENIVNAAIIAGESQSSTDLAHAFLLNMIAIETLLTRPGDKHSDRLPERVEAFIGWNTNWKTAKYEEKIRRAYKKRCDFVHAGQTGDINVSDVLFTDILLLNIFHNILKHLKKFTSKDELVDFSKRVQAEKFLSMKSKQRPKSITFINPHYSGKDYQSINASLE